MLNEYLYYNVFKVLRSSVENTVSVGRQNLDGNEIVQLYALSLKMPKLIEFTTDGVSVCNVIFRVDNVNPESLNEFEHRVFDLVTYNTSANAYVKKYVAELHTLIDKLLYNNSAEADRYFRIMCTNSDYNRPNLKHKIIEAINFYTEGFITSAGRLLYDFFDKVREVPYNEPCVSHTAAVLHILRKSKSFLKVYNNMQPLYIMAVEEKDSKEWSIFRKFLKEVNSISDDCVIPLVGELKNIEDNYGVLKCSNSNNRFSIIIRDDNTGLAHLVSVGWPEDI